MFCKTSNSATVTGKLFSIVQISRGNGLKVEQYLKYLIENIQKKPLDFFYHNQWNFWFVEN